MLREIFDSLGESLPGLLAVSVVGRDGIEVDHLVRGDLPHEVFSAEMGGVLRNLERVETELELGPPIEVVIRTESQNILLVSLSRELFVLAITDPSVATGKTRYEIQRRSHRFLDLLT